MNGFMGPRHFFSVAIQISIVMRGLVKSELYWPSRMAATSFSKHIGQKPWVKRALECLLT